MSINEIKEILIKMYVYTGFPRSLNGIYTFMGVVEEREQKDIKDELGKETWKAIAAEDSNGFFKNFSMILQRLFIMMLQ